MEIGEFLDVTIRQAHPGERRGAYRDYEEKLDGAREGKREEGIPWTVLWSMTTRVRSIVPIVRR